MNTNPLIPGISTHFRCIEDVFLWNLTVGKIYKILEWEDDYYHFLNDKGERRRRWSQYDAVDVSYERNLEKILE